MPCPGPFHFSYSVDYIYDFCPLPDPDVGLSVFVCDVEIAYFNIICITSRPPTWNSYFACHFIIYFSSSKNGV